MPTQWGWGSDRLLPLLLVITTCAMEENNKRSLEWDIEKELQWEGESDGESHASPYSCTGWETWGWACPRSPQLVRRDASWHYSAMNPRTCEREGEENWGKAVTQKGAGCDLIFVCWRPSAGEAWTGSRYHCYGEVDQDPGCLLTTDGPLCFLDDDAIPAHRSTLQADQ
jgi:hypothetical protein